MHSQRVVLQVSKKLAQDIITYVANLLNVPSQAMQIGGSNGGGTLVPFPGLSFEDHDLGVIVLRNAAFQNVTYTSNAFYNYPGQDIVTIEIQYLANEPGSLPTVQATPKVSVRGHTATVVKKA